MRSLPCRPRGPTWLRLCFGHSCACSRLVLNADIRLHSDVRALFLQIDDNGRLHRIASHNLLSAARSCSVVSASHNIVHASVEAELSEIHNGVRSPLSVARLSALNLCTSPSRKVWSHIGRQWKASQALTATLRWLTFRTMPAFWPW